MKQTYSLSRRAYGFAVLLLCLFCTNLSAGTIYMQTNLVSSMPTWGITLAPGKFGQFSNDLLIGQFGNGEILAYDPTSDAFLGTLNGKSGMPIVNDFLWSLEVRTMGPNVNPNALYFTAGIDNQSQGLFGEITLTPGSNVPPIQIQDGWDISSYPREEIQPSSDSTVAGMRETRGNQHYGSEAMILRNSSSLNALRVSVVTLPSAVTASVNLAQASSLGNSVNMTAS